MKTERYGDVDVDVNMDWLPERLRSFGQREAVTGRGGQADYTALAERVDAWGAELSAAGVRRGASVAVIGDTSVGTVSLVLALILRGCVVVPLAPADPPPGARGPRLDIAAVETVVEFRAPDDWQVSNRPAPDSRHALLDSLRAAGEAGLVLFSSGSTGEVKAALHSFPRLLDRFRTHAGRPLRTMQFMALDHIGGVNTLFHTLTGGGTVIVENRRTAEEICRTVETHRAELLPTTPTFLNMLLISGAYKNHDLSSLRLMTYGTEPMRDVTLAHLAETFPGVRLKQTYGLTETGILPTRSESSGSLLMRVGGDGFETRIVDGTLHIRSASSMLGYLNSPDPFDADGWMDTGDAVELAGDGLLRIIGRRSLCINVGGEKVYPAHVENVLLQAANVRDVVVEGRANAVTGQIVTATVEVIEPEDARAMSRRLRAHCAEQLAPHQVPAVITQAEGQLHSSRFKRQGRTV
ncbi:class I adenylate-forming enzyme family protein [Streptomyces sp. NBC_01092]|uniref:class I adenylate-forming enzyme family protein n=1 Tax=Streptomyces sp. NBC_01092 TaxID=2903748 RepID=UPI003863F56E|nr:fatty acid--CoA ligase family protein [Streptomyces sp. NBC_01092]